MLRLTKVTKFICRYLPFIITVIIKVFETEFVYYLKPTQLMYKS